MLDAVPIIEGSGRIVGADGSPIGGGGPPTTATNWAGDSPVNPWQLAEGRAPNDVAEGEPYEVVIDRASATTGDLHVGDHTIIQMPEPIDVTIVGVATFGAADSSGPMTYTAFTDAAAAELVGRAGRGVVDPRGRGDRRREPGRSSATTSPRRCRPTQRP